MCLFLVSFLCAATPYLVLADESRALPVRCVSDADNPIIGCWKRLYPSGNAQKDNAIWSFHPDGYMRNGMPADLALGNPRLTGAFRLDAWSGRYVLRVEDAAGSSRWPTMVVEFPSHDRMFWFRQGGEPFLQRQRVDALGKGAIFADARRLKDHFVRHGHDFGARTPSEYERLADVFLIGPRSRTTLERIRPNGDIVLYNTTTDEFRIISNNNRIRTYYTPNPAMHGYDSNLSYFYAQ